MKKTSQPRGLTLIELTTSMVVSAIVLAGVAATFIGVQNVYQREGQLKSAVEGGRVSTAYLENLVRLAGYGIDPRFAIDVDPSGIPGSSKSNFQPPGGAFVTDDFAFRYRDPAYARRGSFDGTTVTLDGSLTGLPNFGVTLNPGRLLMIACPGGAEWAVIRVTGAAATVGTATSSGAPTGFPAPVAASCMTETGVKAPFVMLIREVRLRVIPLGPLPIQRPFLVAFNSIDNGGAGGLDFDPIAADVESFQVSYMMNRGPPPNIAADGAGGNWVMGDENSDTVKVPVVQVRRPLYDDAYAELISGTPMGVRYTADPANVRALQFDISIRSSRDQGRKGFKAKRMGDDVLTPTATDGFFHLDVSTTVSVPNLTSRNPFTPSFPPNTWGS